MTKIPTIVTTALNTSMSDIKYLHVRHENHKMNTFSRELQDSQMHKYLGMYYNSWHKVSTEACRLYCTQYKWSTK